MHTLGVMMLLILIYTRLPIGLNFNIRLWGFVPVGSVTGFTSGFVGFSGPFAVVFYLAFGFAASSFIGTLALGMTLTITQIDHLWYQWTPHTASIVVEPEISSDWYRFCLSGPNHPEACSGESVPLDNHGHAPNIWDNCPSSWLKVCATPPTRRNPSPPVTIFSRTYHLILLAHSNRQCLIRSVSVSRLGRIWTKLIPLTGYLSSKPNIVAKFFSDAEAFLTGFI